MAVFRRVDVTRLDGATNSSDIILELCGYVIKSHVCDNEHMMSGTVRSQSSWGIAAGHRTEWWCSVGTRKTKRLHFISNIGCGC